MSSNDGVGPVGAVMGQKPMVDIPFQQDIFQNYQRGGFAGAEKLVGAKMRSGDSSQIFSKSGEDITSVYAKYMEWQQKQRKTENSRQNYVADTAAAPGRKQTIIVDQTKKDTILGVPGPSSVLG